MIQNAVILKVYKAPSATVVCYAQEDILTASVLNFCELKEIDWKLELEE